MARRNRPDLLQPLQVPTRLVTRNRHSQALEWWEPAPGADLRAVLEAARSERVVAGRRCDDIGRFCSFFFAARAGERLRVGIERYDPDGPGQVGHSDPAAGAR